ncbi:monooxygenase [Chitinophagaceae bacterium MMS25-I14]
MRQNRKISSLLIVCAALLIQACNTGGSREQQVPEKVTFTEHIAPLLYQNCTVCHRPGGNGHFSLVTYNDAKNNAGKIAYVTKERLMPPWPADPHYTEFIGQRVLSDYDIKLIGKWIEQGSAEGPADKLPSLPQYPAGSMIGTPDLRLPVQPYMLKANSSDHFLLVKVPFELPADTFASVIEFVAGPQNVVHHVNGDMVKYDFDKKKDVMAGLRTVDMVEDSTIRQAYERLGLPNDDGSYPVLQKSVVNYLPGVFSLKYPAGIGGYKLPRKGAFLLNDLHYGFSKKDVTDSSYINIFFSKVPPDRPMQEFQLGTLGVSPVEPDLIIQPNTVKKVYSRYVVPQDISIVTINPHMHLLGKSFKAYALKPGGDTIRLISIPRWDFSWQYFYTFKKMVKIPAGSTIVAEGVYDNTAANPFNPFNPPQLVRDRNGSMKATDEMFQFIISYLPYKEGDENISLETK